MNYIILWVMILFTYLSLSTNISSYNLLFGSLMAILILYLSPVRKHSVTVKHFFKGFVALVIYLLLLIKNTLIGGIQVARLVLDPQLSLKTGVIAVNPDCDHELGQALSAHSISLSPGELLITTDEKKTMYIHSLNIEQTEKVIKKEQQYRRYLLDLIFG